MPRLVLVNGSPAAGKSTLARRYAMDHPGTRVLEIDRLIAFQRSWHDDALDAGRAACDYALRRADQMLREGLDVVVPQYFGRLHMVDELSAVAARTGARFVHVVLTLDPELAVRRFLDRGTDNVLHAQALELAQGSGGMSAVRDAGARVAEVVRQRPGAVLIESTDEDPTYARLLAALA